MADTHFVTNKGKYLILTDLNVNPTTYYMGLIEGTSKPTAIDTEAEVQDLNTVNDLLSLTGVDEPTGASGYARVTLTTYTATEDDTNNRVNIDFANVSFGALGVGGNIIGGFIAKEVGTDSQDLLVSVFLRDVSIPTNGATHTENVADLFRLV